MSTTSPATTAYVSQPPATPSNQATSHATVSFDGTSSILFTFLVIFLAFFGMCMLFGLCTHHLVRGRRRALRAQAEEWEQSVLARGGDGRGRPVLWDVWTKAAANEQYIDIDGQGLSGLKWEDTKPLSVQKLTSHGTPPTGTSTTRPSLRTARTTTNPYITAITDRSTRPPTNTQLATDALRDLFTRGTLSPPHLPPTTPSASAPSSKSASKVDLGAGAGTGTAVRVAVLVAMPSPRRVVPDGDEKARWRAEEEEEGLREYVVGVAKARVV